MQPTQQLCESKMYVLYILYNASPLPTGLRKAKHAASQATSSVQYENFKEMCLVWKFSFGIAVANLFEFGGEKPLFSEEIKNANTL